MGKEIVPLLTEGNFVWSGTAWNFDTPFLRQWNKGIWKNDTKRQKIIF